MGKAKENTPTAATEEEQEGRGKETRIWLTIYSDLMTNLTLFFLILFAFTRLSAVQQKKLAQVFSNMGVRKTVPVEEPKKEEDNLEKKLDQFAKVETTEKYIKIVMPTPVLFDLGKADVKPEAKAVLHEIADIIRDKPNEIIVEGHTDNLPIYGGEFSSNWELSAARAFNVIEYFIKEENISPERLIALGYGEYRPVAPNDTEENRRLNRRIEIKIVKE
jgi:chemotaxis protein MotB